MTADVEKHEQKRPGPLPALAFWTALCGLLVFQGWMTLGLFSADRSYTAMIDDRPLLSGRHPEHLYLGAVGAESLWRSGRSCCFDPAFQAGYPKTPIFNGSRLAELAVFVTGGEYSAAVYKIKIAIISMMAPLLLALAGFGVGLERLGIIVAVTLGLLVWWGNPCQSALAIGDVDLLVASLAALAHVGLLARFDFRPTVSVWFGLVLTGCLAWFAQPLIFLLLLPLFLVYYLSVGAKHSSLTWHIALWGGQLVGIGVNLGWLLDWVSFWWVRAPVTYPLDGILPHRTIGTVWNASLWGGAIDRALAVALLACSVVGIMVWHLCQRRPAARMIGWGVGGLFAIAVLGITLKSFGGWQTARLITAALWFAALPAACALIWACGYCRRLLGNKRFAWTSTAVLGSVGFVGLPFFVEWRDRIVTPRSLIVGLNDQQQALVNAIRKHTGPEARILWETKNEAYDAPRWTALLPMMTHRYFVGGFDVDCTIAHSTVGFAKGELAGRALGRWHDAGLRDYCRRYNIGWVVCWSAAASERFRNWTDAKTVCNLPGSPPGLLFRIDKRAPNYALRGHAKLVYADCQRITLSEVVPDSDGVVVLSMHYQSGIRALPSRVQVEREPDGDDPIGFIRLSLARPAASVTLTWDEP